MRYNDRVSEYYPSPLGVGNLLKLCRDRDRSLQLWSVNEEFLVRTSHHLVLITSLPFVHTARRFNRLDDPANYSDFRSQLHCERKCREPYHLEDEEVVTRYP